MQPTLSQTTDPESPNGSVKPARVSWRSVTKNVLASLKGWQAIPAIIIGLYFVLGVFGPTLAPFDPNAVAPETHSCPPLAINALNISDNPSDRFSHCRATNFLGTDEVGRDIFSRLLHGARTSLSMVVPSVFIGTMLGIVVGALANGLGRKSRLVAYATLGLTIVPFAILVSGHFGMFFGAYPIFIVFGDHALGWTAILASSTFSAVLTFALIAFAYQYDHMCRRSWVSEVDAEEASIGFYQLLRKQIVTLAPWIGLAALANAALVFLSQDLAIDRWSAWEYQFEHIGSLSPFVLMVLFPIGFVTFGMWWFVHHVRGRLMMSYEPSLESPQGVADGAEELSTEEEASHFESRASEDNGNDTLTKSSSRLKRRRWMMVVIGIVAAAAVVRFGTAEAIPIARQLAQDSDGGYESAWVKSRQEWDEVTNCAREIDARLMELESDQSANSEIEASQRCRDLYFQFRIAPSHLPTIRYALRFLTHTLTLALAASIVSAVLWTAASVSTRVVRRTAEVIVVLVALVGLTVTFGLTGWHIAVIRWLDPVDSATVGSAVYSDILAISRSFYIVRDFAVALGISYLTIAMTKPTLPFPKTDAMLDDLSKWASFFVPCALLISGLLILFHWPFPTIWIIYEGTLSVIVDPRLGDNSAHSDPEDWLWTYWFASIGYAAIVFGFFAAAIWGFERIARSGADSIDPTPVNPDNPSQAASPT